MIKMSQSSHFPKSQQTPNSALLGTYLNTNYDDDDDVMLIDIVPKNALSIAPKLSSAAAGATQNQVASGHVPWLANCGCRECRRKLSDPASIQSVNTNPEERAYTSLIPTESAEQTFNGKIDHQSKLRAHNTVDTISSTPNYDPFPSSDEDSESDDNDDYKSDKGDNDSDYEPETGDESEAEFDEEDYGVVVDNCSDSNLSTTSSDEVSNSIVNKSTLRPSKNSQKLDKLSAQDKIYDDLFSPTYNKDNIARSCQSQDLNRSRTYSSSIKRLHRKHRNHTQHKCPFEGCLKVFGSKQNLARHLVVHTGEQPFQCTKCKQRFNQEANLMTHYRVAHKAFKPYLCKWTGCNYGKASYRKVVHHVETVHLKSGDSRKAKKFIENRTGLDSPEYECPFMCCKLALHTKGLLKLHLKVHRNQHTLCGRCCRSKFDRLTDFVRHVRSHRANGYRCRWAKCNFFDASKSRVNQHIAEGHLRCKLGSVKDENILKKYRQKVNVTS